MVPAFLTAFFFALSAICASRASRLVGSFAAAFARLWFAAAMLAVWAHLYGSGLRGAGRTVFMLSGTVGFGLGDLAFFAALPLIGSRLATLMVQCLAAPLAAAIEWMWLGTRLDARQLCCGTAILFGVGLAIAPERLPAPSADPHGSTGTAARRGRGLLFGGIAALGQAGGAVISRKAYALSQNAGLAVDGGTAAYQRALGGLIVVTAAYLLTRRRPSAPAAKAAGWDLAWPWILANGFVGAVLGVSCYQWALATTPSAVVLPIVALTPLAVVPFAYLMEGERPGVRSLCGGVIAVVAAAVLARSR